MESGSWTQFEVETPDGPLVYQRSRAVRSATGPRVAAADIAVVCCHGFSDSAGTWLPVVEQWLGRYDLILPDARGHGLSGRLPDHQRAPDADLDDLLACLLHAQVGGAILVGHSMGANTVARFAARHPDLTRAVVLEDPPWRRSHENGGSARNWLARLQKLKPASIARLNRRNHGDWSEAEHSAWIAAKLAADPNLLRPLPAGSAPVPRPSAPDLAQRLAACDMPGLLLTGDPTLGAIVHPDTVAELRQIWPSMQHLEFAAAHEIRRDQPAAFARAVADFIDDVLLT